MRQKETTMKRAKHDLVVDPTVFSPKLGEQQEEVARAQADLEPGRSDRK